MARARHPFPTQLARAKMREDERESKEERRRKRDLQVELGRNAQRQVHVESVMVRLERLRLRRSTGGGGGAVRAGRRRGARVRNIRARQTKRDCGDGALARDAVPFCVVLPSRRRGAVVSIQTPSLRSTRARRGARLPSPALSRGVGATPRRGVAAHSKGGSDSQRFVTAVGKERAWLAQ